MVDYTVDSIIINVPVNITDVLVNTLEHLVEPLEKTEVVFSEFLVSVLVEQVVGLLRWYGNY